MADTDFAGFTDTLASVSGGVILPLFRAGVAAEDKSGGGTFDPVTEADRAAEKAMRKEIYAAFPDHGIVGEEFGVEREDARFVWVLDPIDGTKAFISGFPVWGTLIGLLENGKAVCGMMHQPFIAERFSGDGRTARYRGPHGDRTLRTRRCATLAQATLSTTSPALIPPDLRGRYQAVEDRARLVRYGFDCYAYCMLAGGHIDVVVEAGLKPYDIVALVPIIEGAGGVVSTWTGGRPESGGAIVASGDPALHDEVLRVLASA